METKNKVGGENQKKAYENDNFVPKQLDLTQIDGSSDDTSRFAEALTNFGLIAGHIVSVLWKHNANTAANVTRAKVKAISETGLLLVAGKKQTEFLVPYNKLQHGSVEILQGGQRYGVNELQNLMKQFEGRFYGKSLEELKPLLGKLVSERGIYADDWTIANKGQAAGRVTLHMNPQTHLIGTGFEAREKELKKPQVIETVAALEIKALDRVVVPAGATHADQKIEEGKRVSDSVKEAAKQNNGSIKIETEKGWSFSVGATEPVQRYESKILNVRITESIWNDLSSGKSVETKFDFVNKNKESVKVDGVMYLDKQLNKIKYRFQSEAEKAKMSSKISEAVVVDETKKEVKKEVKKEGAKLRPQQKV